MSCITAGRVIAEFEIVNKLDKKKETFQLTLSPAQEELSIKKFNDLFIKLVDVEPLPLVGKKFHAQDYSINIDVYKNEK